MAKAVKPTAPDHLTMRLFAPGMTALHRAGLGGLACTLKAMEKQHAAGLLRADRLPAPFTGDQPPWNIDDQTVTLHFGKPENAGEYLKRLFAFGFQIRNGLIYLPGQYDAEPSAAVLADLQLGVTLTFLQHGRVRQLAKTPTVASYDPEGEGVPGVVVEYRACSGFKHQAGWGDFAAKAGCLTVGEIKVDGPLSPGSAVRHVAYTADTAAADPPERMLPLYFAAVGCLPLAVNRGVAALLIPEVEDLTDFVQDRPAMTPTTATACVIANAADGALQSQVRLRAREEMGGRAVPGVYAMTFRPTAWASQQKSRVATVHVPTGDDQRLDRFARALAWLPTRVVTRTVQESTGRGRQRVTTERRESFRAGSVVRPLVAENLALGRKWYAGFVDLMTKLNPATDRPYRDQLPFERGGLHAMTADPDMWDDEGEPLVVRAVHEAMRTRYGQIAEENKSNPAGRKSRMERFRERLRLALAGAKREADVRFALTDLFSRGGYNQTLRDSWTKVLPVLRQDWQLARDLGLLALASYSGRGVEDAPYDPTDPPKE